MISAVRCLVVGILTCLTSLAIAADVPPVRDPAKAGTEVIRVPVTVNAAASAGASKKEFSLAPSPRIKLKNLGEMALLDFDWKVLGNRPIVAAELFVRSDLASVALEQKRLNLGELFPLRLIGLSTVSSPWGENSGSDWAWPGSALNDVIFGAGHSVCCRAELERVGADGWWKVKVEPKVLDTLRTGGGFGLCVADESSGPGPQSPNNQIWSREQAGSEPYLMVTVGPPPPDGNPPAAPKVTAGPPPAGELETGSLALAVDGSQATLKDVTYRLTVGGQLVKPWQIEPFPVSLSSGLSTWNVINLVVTDLPADREVDVELVVQTPLVRYPPVVLKTRTGPKLAAPAELPARGAAGPEAAPAADGKFTVLALPESVKVDPFGQLLEGARAARQPTDATTAPAAETPAVPAAPAAPVAAAPMPNWGTAINLSAARGQIVACQLLLDASKSNPGPVNVSVSDLVGPDGAKIPADKNVRLFREWYVKVVREQRPPGPRPPAETQPEGRAARAGGRGPSTRPAGGGSFTIPGEGTWQPELAIPMPRTALVKESEPPSEPWFPPVFGPISIPDSTNAVPGQTHQLVWIDLFVPPATPPGDYTASATIIAQAAGNSTQRTITMRVKVFNAVIPPEVKFIPELNAYDPPAAPGSKSYLDAHRLTQYHRATLNVLPYKQKGPGDLTYRPTTLPDGHAVDWSEFDRCHGPLLDGSAFADNPRPGVGVSAFYLPLNENWPAPFWPNYPCAARQGDSYPFGTATQPEDDTLITRHHLAAPPIEQALTRGYQQAWRNLAADYRKHFEAKGWSTPIFECFLNNKFFKAHSMFWCLDEPSCRQDFLAIRFFGQLWMDGAKPGPSDKVKLWYRGDISRGEQQYNDLNGVMQIEYVNSDVFNIPRTVREAARRAGSVFIVYGVCNSPGVSNLETVSWSLGSYIVGGDGVLPWESLDKTGKSLTTMNGNGLIVWGGPAGADGWVASLRVFAMRRGAQDVELLRLLSQKKGYTRDQIGGLVSRYMSIKGSVTPQDRTVSAGRGRDEGKRITSDSLLDMETGVLKALE